MPPDVGDRRGRDLIKWPEEHERRLDAKQRLLWDFCCSVYPARQSREGEVTAHSPFESTRVHEFQEARGHLAHFWDRAARTLSPTYLAREYHSARLDFVLLSWLDIALKQQTHDEGQGKIGLFQVGNAATTPRT